MIFSDIAKSDGNKYIFRSGHYTADGSTLFGTDTVTHDAVVTLRGGSIHEAAGSWHGLATVGGERILVFDDFTGSCDSFHDFDHVVFDGESGTLDLSAATAYNIGTWGFDAVGRTDNTHALVDFGTGAIGLPSTIDLRIADDASVTTWDLATWSSSQDLSGVTFRLSVDGAEPEVSTSVAYDTAIGTGTFAGYKFTVDDATNTLKFAKLA